MVSEFFKNKMGIIAEKIAHLRKFTPDVMEQELLEIVRDNEQVITAMNTDQLFSGKRSDGSDMPPYSRASVEIFGKPDGPIRLFDEGNFYRRFFIDADKFPVRVDSSDPKTVMLVEGTQFKRGFGENIFGITRDNQEHLNKDYILDAYRKRNLEIVQG
jgi:hypothetical protein